MGVSLGLVAVVGRGQCMANRRSINSKLSIYISVFLGVDKKTYHFVLGNSKVAENAGRGRGQIEGL